jgi:hypothetical protein
MQAKRYNETMSEVNKNLSKIASEELSRSKILLETAKNTNLSYEQRIKAVDELQKRYPDYLGNLSKEEILAGNTAKAENELSKALINRATAMAAINMIEENVRKRLENQKKLALELAEIERIRAEQGKNRVKIVGDLEKETELNKERDEILRQTYATEALAQIRFKEKNDLLNEEEKILLNLFNSNSKYLDIVNELNTQNTKSNKNSREKIEAIKLEGKQIEGILPLIRRLINQEEELLSVTSNPKSRKDIKENLETLKKGLESIENPLKVVEESAKRATEELANLHKKGSKSAEKSGKDWKQSFQDWSSVAVDAIQTVQEAQNQQTQNQLNDLERQKNIAILFAGESATAREEIERQYDEKRRQILERQARQDKAYAIVNSIINTARGVVSALAMTPPNIPLSIAVGVIGAAQTALIASQQIPQFYKGTDNAPEGWAWTQEKGAEIITDKSGRVKDIGSNSGPKLTYLSKGDKVFTADQSKNIMFNKELNSILNNNGILPTNVINNKLDLLPLRSDIRSLENTIKNKSELHMISDRQGERVYQKEQGKRALLVSNRLRIK